MADLPCPTCGSTLTFIDQYQRYYCHRCLAYAPEGYGDHGAQTCPTCGGILSYVRQYGRMYCYRCNSYAPDQPAPEMKAETPAAPEPQPAQAVATASTSEPSTSGPESEPSPAGSALVLALTTPAPEAATEPAEAPKAESEGQESDSSKESETPSESPPPVEPTAKAEEVAPAPPSKEMQILAGAKPAAIRVKLFALKKPELVDLCRVYHLDTNGTKEDIQQRLLAYLHDVELEGEAKETAAGVQETPPMATTSEGGEQVAVPRAEEPHEVPAASGSAQPAAAAMVEEISPQTAPAPVIVTPAPAAAEVLHGTARAEHPCPTCARELTYISQYNRWYCYYCQRYAPAAARARNACPTCGATMRWIDQHHRWWCDACQKYASADLPAPGRVTQAAAIAEPAVATPGLRAIVVHRHGSPAGGAGLVGFGLALYMVYAFFAYLGAMMGIVTPSGITPEVLSLLQFFGFLFVALGAIAGLYGMRDRT